MDAKPLGRASPIDFNYRYLLEVLKDKDGPVLLETVTPTGVCRFTHYASPNILVMSMSTGDREAEAVAASEEEVSEKEPGDGDHHEPTGPTVN